jgi:hypothetical protein
MPPADDPSESPADHPGDDRREQAQEDPPPLVAAPCRTLCSWAPAGRRRAGLAVFACSGCGSEWVRSEPWTPIDADGVLPEAVAAEARSRA